MLSHRDKSSVISILNSVLGTGIDIKGERVHYCPFCGHRKPKLQINLESQKWHCWVCDSKGKKIISLLYKLESSVQYKGQIKSIYGSQLNVIDTDSDQEITLTLPREFKPLWKSVKGINPMYNKAREYARKRNISDMDLFKYNIGYCDSGYYGGTIIVPSYDINNKLNYFVSRSIFDNANRTYVNPPVSRNVVMFENMINWNEPIVLVEGVFDAIAIKRNSIPLLGKFISKKLNEKIYSNGVSDIIIFLDSDAQKYALKYTMEFMNQGINVKNIIPTEKDPSDMGFTQSNNIILNSSYSNYSDIVKQKILNI